MKEKLRKLIAERIKLIIVFTGISQEQLSEEIGVSQVSISNWILEKSDIKVIHYLLFVKYANKVCRLDNFYYQYDNNNCLYDIVGRRFK